MQATVRMASVVSATSTPRRRLIRVVRPTAASLVRFMDTSDPLSRFNGGFTRYDFRQSSDIQTLSVDCGLLFLMAFWSGPAVMALKTVCRALSQASLPAHFCFRVLDVDGVPREVIDELIARAGLASHGYGEGYWFRDGQIFAAERCHVASESRILDLLTQATHP